MPNSVLTSAEIGALIRAGREALGLSKTELGRRLNVSRKWVYHMERGRASVSLGLVLSAFQLLNISLAATLEPPQP